MVYDYFSLPGCREVFVLGVQQLGLRLTHHCIPLLQCADTSLPHPTLFTPSILVAHCKLDYQHMKMDQHIMCAPHNYNLLDSNI